MMAGELPDVTVRDEGTIVQFIPNSDAARAWFKENVQAEGWQWMGPALCVDARPAQDLAQRLEEEGFTIA